ncbi:lytic polysaccharide monooxygenase [Streptomyces albus subsp. chlorinus]|uniref:lytic polysaccharide monooxygenase auxiliary activity family 9 protein n=1 Tax=Streptomyces albus TaxID=1888 RepID=UPI0015705E2E|nr:lytic polysaccharide monooxygenase auxiliary activity family 9 protein [Streptomyces albus]NSC24875.1 lytic polysaccharide monooxygenase [Streptomyces albus subsp. chlorinus]
MHKKRKWAALIGAGLSPLLVLGLSVTPASAHGYISDPASRQAQCAAGVVECGSIKYEPQSVEGPKGLQDCAGGHDEWAELRDDNHGWNVANVGRSATFNWTLTAPHRTTTWEYYIDGQKIAEFDQGGQQPPNHLSHQVDFGGFSGRQTVLAVWNVADTANAFYACVDVNIG